VVPFADDDWNIQRSAPIFSGGENTGVNKMSVETHSYNYRDYEIVVTHTPPYFQAAIYPTKPTLQTIDWELKPIRAANMQGAVELAKQRINIVLAQLASQTT
jgi:hypothetical protein